MFLDEYVRRKDDSVFKEYSEQDRNDRGAPRIGGRGGGGGQRGGSRASKSSFERGSGSENYRNNSQNSQSVAHDSSNRGRQKEIPKYAKPEMPVCIET